VPALRDGDRNFKGHFWAHRPGWTAHRPRWTPEVGRGKAGPQQADVIERWSELFRTLGGNGWMYWAIVTQPWAHGGLQYEVDPGHPTPIGSANWRGA
jgi:hypothetical protein